MFFEVRYDNADTTAQDAIEGRNMQHTDVINGVVEEALNLMGDEQSSLDETSSYEETVGGDNTHITFTFSDHDAEESREASFYLHGTKANTLADVLTTFKMFLNAAGFTYVDGLVAYGNEGEVSSR